MDAAEDILSELHNYTFPLHPDFIKNTNFSDFQEIWNRVPDWEISVKVIGWLPIIIIGFIGNIAIIYVMFKIKSMRTSINLFILNMAIADFLTVICSSWIILVNNFYQKYVLGQFFCKLEGVIQVTFLVSSAFSLIAISLDRLLGIIYPFSNRLSKKKTFVILAAIWISAVVIASPFAIWRSYNQRQWADYLEIWCYEDLEKARYYWIVILILLVYLPLTFMTIAYLILFRKLEAYEKILTQRENPRRVKYRRKVIKMLFIYLLNFLWCWSLFQFVVFYRHFRKKGVLPNWFKHVFFAAHLLSYTNGALNSIVYGVNSVTYRRALRLLFPILFKTNRVIPSAPRIVRRHRPASVQHDHPLQECPNRQEHQKPETEEITLTPINPKAEREEIALTPVYYLRAHTIA